MLEYKGLNCPVCGVVFREDDDIVVCPACGAPYHRACYAQVGECIFGDLHRRGEDWAPPAPPQPEPPEPTAEIKDRECPACGTLNAHSAVFCNRCGASLIGKAEPGGERPQGRQAPFRAVPPGGIPGAAFSFGDPMGGVSPTEELDQGVTFGDASKLVRVNTGYYMPVFWQIKKQRRNKFNFSAFLFSGGWFLYRKQYKAGAVITAVMLGLYALFMVLYLTVAVPALQAAAGEAGIDLTETVTLSTQETLELSEILASDPDAMVRISGFLLIPPLMLGVMLYCGFRGNQMYLDHCVKILGETRAWGEDLQQVLEEKGGVSSVAALIAAMALLVLRMGLMLLLGTALL